MYIYSDTGDFNGLCASTVCCGQYSPPPPPPKQVFYCLSWEGLPIAGPPALQEVYKLCDAGISLSLMRIVFVFFCSLNSSLKFITHKVQLNSDNALSIIGGYPSVPAAMLPCCFSLVDPVASVDILGFKDRMPKGPLQMFGEKMWPFISTSHWQTKMLKMFDSVQMNTQNLLFDE